MPLRDHDRRPTLALEQRPLFWLVSLTISLLAGQGLAATSFSIAPAALATLCALTLALIPTRLRRWGLLAALGVAFFSLGYIRHQRLLNPTFGPTYLRSIAGGDAPVYVEGLLYREPERLVDRSRWYLNTERVWHPTGAEAVSGNLLLTVRASRRDWHYGDRVRLRVRPQVPGDFGNPGGFDYASFLARRNIYATAFLDSDESVELVARGSAGIWRAIEHMRVEISRFMERHFPHDSAALMKALVVGDMGGVSSGLRTDFTAAGVNHVLSISGLHVGMLGLVAFLAIRFFGSFSTAVLLRWNVPKIAAFVSFIAVVFYTALAGAMLPTVRSAIMIAVYELAVLLDREEELFSSMAIAALLIALFWPGVIMDISFQLSFLAVLFIVWGVLKLHEWWPAAPREGLPQERSWLRGWARAAGFYLAVPVLATVGTGPMIAYHFGHLSLAGFVANPIVVPLIGFVVVPLGLILGLCSLLSPALALPFLWLAEPLLSLVLWLVRFFAALPWASIAVPIPNLFEVALLYLLILSALLCRRRVHLFVLLGALAIVSASEAVYWWRERWNRKDLRVTHLSVGHGDATVVELPGSKVLVIDAGGTATGEFDTGESIVAPFLRSRKILRVDYLLVSHARVDHYGGMQAIVEQFSPSEFWSAAAAGRTARYRELERAVERSGARRIHLSSRDPCRTVEAARLCVLHPPPDPGGDSSVVVRLTFGGTHFLFAADIEKRDERVLLRSGEDLSSVVLKVPRHGSLTSSSEDFVAAVRPRLAIFSVGQRRRFGLPRDEVVARYAAAGAEILRTDEDGAIVIETDGARMRYRAHGSGKRGELAVRAR